MLADGLQQLVGETQAAVDEYGICFLASDVDADGGKLIMTAGAPKASLDGEERMLLALRRIVDVGSAIPFRIGVNRGPVFAGDVGPRYRRTYTVMGDAVNLAARVMAKAHPGQVLATGSILDASDIRFETQALEPFMVKGKRDPVTAFLVGPIADVQVHSDEDDLPLVGRQEEIAAIDDAMAGAKEGRGHTIEIVGPPGIGKTRLLRELRSRAEAFEHLEATCELYAQGTAYAPFRDAAARRARHRPAGARRGCGAAPSDQGVRGRRRSCSRGCRCSPSRSTSRSSRRPRWTPWPRSSGAGSSSGRWPSSCDSSYEGRPVLVTIEDAHWMDDASGALLSSLLPGIAGGAVARRDHPPRRDDRVRRARGRAAP